MVYKYTKYFPSIFNNFEFRFSSPKQLNDPFEGQIDYSSVVKSAEKSKWKDENIKAKYLEKAKEGPWNEDIRIFSMSYSNDNLLLWTHYADCHRGIVIEFDSSNIYFRQSIDLPRDYSFPPKLMGRLVPVQYNKKKIKDHEYFNKPPLLNKSIDWIYEQEYRFILPREYASSKIKDENGQDIELFKIPESAIKTVILGANSNWQKIATELKDAFARKNINHIKILKAEINKDYYLVDFNEINL
ncbi:MAG: DUF2971 domain-containing protein [Desulfocucumaceae bacterium]